MEGGALSPEWVPAPVHHEPVVLIQEETIALEVVAQGRPNGLPVLIYRFLHLTFLGISRTWVVLLLDHKLDW